MPDIFPIFLAFSAFCPNTSFISFTQKANLIQFLQMNAHSEENGENGVLLEQRLDFKLN